MISRWTSVCQSIRLPVRPSIFSFLDDNLSKYKWIFNKLSMCFDIEEIWFGIANGQISSIFYIFDRVIRPVTRPFFHFLTIT